MEKVTIIEVVDENGVPDDIHASLNENQIEVLAQSFTEVFRSIIKNRRGIANEKS